VAASVICALATPPGRAAIAVVRLSGPGCHALVQQVCRPQRGGPLVPARAPRWVRVVNAAGVVVDDAMVWLGRGPRTFTGEDVAELSVHGNPVVVAAVLATLREAGAVDAEPGAFTRRAVEAGRMDLLAAEGLAALLDAKGWDGVLAARAALEGDLAAGLAPLRTALVDALATLEVALDHPEEADALGDAVLAAPIEALITEASALLVASAQAQRAVHGARVVLVGEPNAGKSSLFNALLGEARAIVHPSAGTTRDGLQGQTTWRGVPITWVDTAGDRDATDPIEALGVARARAERDAADLIIVVLRARIGGPTPGERALLDATAGHRRLVVINGVDEAPAPEGSLTTVAIHAQGVEALADAVIAALVDVEALGARVAAINDRQASLLRAIVVHAREALHALPWAGVAVAAEQLLDALGALDALTGADGREDVRDRVFSRFCIGK
jgi:tRNA modification GTPase